MHVAFGSVLICGPVAQPKSFLCLFVLGLASPQAEAQYLVIPSEE